MDAEGHLKNVIANLNREEHWDDGLRHAVREAEKFLENLELGRDILADPSLDGDAGGGLVEGVQGTHGKVVTVVGEQDKVVVVPNEHGVVASSKMCPVLMCGRPARLTYSGWVCSAGHGF
jgi:hypothetical protein